MAIVTPDIDRYLDRLASHDDPVLDEMERRGRRDGFPIVGPQVGRLLRTLAVANGARRVLELGSGFGYSAYWFAGAVGTDGEVVLTEGSPERARDAGAYLERGGFADRVRIEVGDALGVLASIDGPFDIVFNDIDKEAYPDVLPGVKRVLRPGGLFVSDNMLWFGRVLEEDPEDPATAGVVGLTRALARDPDFHTTLLPVRDGVSVSVRLP